MYPLHDNDLDRLSRDAAEHYEVDFGPAGWERLEKRLDQELPVDKGKRRRFLFWLFFIVVTTGGALTGLLINSQPVTPLASNHMQAISPAQDLPAALNNPADQKVSGKNKAAGPIQHNKTETPAATTIKKPVDAGTPTTTKDVAVNGQPKSAPDYGAMSNNADKTVDGFNKPFTNKKGRSGTMRRTVTAPVNYDAASNYTNRKKPTRNNDKNDVINKGRNKVPGKDMAATQEPVNQVAEPATDEPVVTTTPATEGKTTRPTTDQPKAAAADSAATPAIAEKPKENKSKKDQDRGFEFGITAGPDVSMVEFGPLDKTGYNAGVQIGYRLSNRWSINTGVLYTKRFYKATGEQFHPPKHSTPSYRDVEKLKGYCAMLDIPVNVRYNFVYNDKRRFFGSAGASTYLMHDQYYGYTYKAMGGGTLWDDWGSKKPDNYWFSVLNLSVGYERIISKRLSIQAEPYLKVPLTGIGAGSMKMGSYGMFFSLKYRPASGSRK